MQESGESWQGGGMGLRAREGGEQGFEELGEEVPCKNLTLAAAITARSARSGSCS